MAAEQCHSASTHIAAAAADGDLFANSLSISGMNEWPIAAANYSNA